MAPSFRGFKSFIKKVFWLWLFFSSTIVAAKADGVEITSYGHSSLLIRGGGKSVLLNPFKAVGCAEGLVEPQVKADVILASSELADEGARVAKGTFFVQPGSYQFGNMRLEGFTTPHDRIGGRRYGLATLWQWRQGELNFAHLGGSVSPLKPEDKVILGRPDVLIIAVGGGAKVYDGSEAAKIVSELNPKIVIPVQYVRDSKPSNCDQTGVQPFLNAMSDVEVQRVGKTYLVPGKLRDKTVINLMQ